jgi:threonine dehydrogenase-like Zn-dependent dehydrogenase
MNRALVYHGKADVRIESLPDPTPRDARGVVVRPERVFTHRMPLSKGAEAYALFDARSDGVMKVMLDPDA